MSTLTDVSTSKSNTLPNQHTVNESSCPPNPVSQAETGTVLTIEDIHRLLPHRYPFSLVDRIVEYIPGKRAVGIKNVSVNEPHFQGHFPGRPIMPGVLIVEAMAQVGGIILTQLPERPEGLLMFAGIDKVRFRRPVVPGDQLVMTLELISVKRRRFGKMQGRAEVDGQLVTEGELLFSVVD